MKEDMGGTYLLLVGQQKLDIDYPSFYIENAVVLFSEREWHGTVLFVYLCGEAFKRCFSLFTMEYILAEDAEIYKPIDAFFKKHS